MIDKALHILEFLILIAVLLIQSQLYVRQHNADSELKITVIKLEKELQESEDRCRRMTDTCIDILSNGRWE